MKNESKVIYGASEILLRLTARKPDETNNAYMECLTDLVERGRKGEDVDLLIIELLSRNEDLLNEYKQIVEHETCTGKTKGIEDDYGIELSDDVYICPVSGCNEKSYRPSIKWPIGLCPVHKRAFIPYWRGKD